MSKSKNASRLDNVFADLGIDGSEEYLQKVDLAIRINDIVTERGLTQNETAALLGIDQPNVSLLKRGLLDSFSIEQIMRFLRLLGQERAIRPKAPSQPQSQPSDKVVI